MLVCICELMYDVLIILYTLNESDIGSDSRMVDQGVIFSKIVYCLYNVLLWLYRNVECVLIAWVSAIDNAYCSVIGTGAIALFKWIGSINGRNVWYLDNYRRLESYSNVIMIDSHSYCCFVCVLFQSFSVIADDRLSWLLNESNDKKKQVMKAC